MKFCRSLSGSLCVFHLLVFIALLAGGCATGPSYRESMHQVPGLSPERGRIYFFREARYAGSLLRPEVRIDGVVVGQSVPGGVFLVDRNPGHCVVECEEKVEFELKGGQEVYVQLLTVPPPGGSGLFKTRVLMIEPEEGRKAVDDLVWIADPLASKKRRETQSSD